MENITEELYLGIKEIGERNKEIDGGLMIALHEIQKKYGYISIAMQEILSRHLKEPLAKINGVVSFYSHFVTEPRGRKQIHVCTGTACYVKGAQKIIDKIETKLGITIDETSSDGEYSLHTTRCIGACGLAPVASVNDDVYGHLENDEIDKMVNEIQVKEDM